MPKIAVIGNAGGGKTTLSRKLSQQLGVPLHHVDSYQFLAGMRIRPHQETIKILREIQAKDHWLIDGYGPLDIIEQRFQLADQIIFIDFPLWRHYWWSLKRQINSLWFPRQELPPECFEANFHQTYKLFRTIWKVHTKMRPELLRILSRPNLREKVCHIRTYRDYENGHLLRS